MIDAFMTKYSRQSTFGDTYRYIKRQVNVGGVASASFFPRRGLPDRHEPATPPYPRPEVPSRAGAGPGGGAATEHAPVLAGPEDRGQRTSDMTRTRKRR